MLVFHHLPTSAKKKTISEIHRVLKPDGKFFLVDFGKPASFLGKILLFAGSLVDGKETMKANMDGVLPLYLQESKFIVSEIADVYLENPNPFVWKS